MSESKTCPKCGNKMTREKIYGGQPIRLLEIDKVRWIGNAGGKVVPFCCSNCGYIELYSEKI